MIRILALIAIVVLVFLGYQQFSETPTSSSPKDSPSPPLTKCVTKEGETYYGEVPNDVICESSETVETSIVVVPAIKTDNSVDTGTSTQSEFQCDGRTYCSQMKSCEEATFFLQNCPNTKMDGDRDGVPCERQWCS